MTRRYGLCHQKRFINLQPSTVQKKDFDCNTIKRYFASQNKNGFKLRWYIR